MQGSKLRRRDLLRGAVLGFAAAPFCRSQTASAETLVKLDEKDSQAVALGYVNDAAQVDPQKYPTYKKGQICANCVQLQGRDGFWRPCTLFPGKLVNAKGWCRVWVQKTYGG